MSMFQLHVTVQQLLMRTNNALHLYMVWNCGGNRNTVCSQLKIFSCAVQ